MKALGQLQASQTLSPGSERSGSFSHLLEAASLLLRPHPDPQTVSCPAHNSSPPAEPLLHLVLVAHLWLTPLGLCVLGVASVAPLP